MDKELLEKIGIKEQDAFNQLYLRYSRLFFRWIYTRIGDPDITNDILQNFWIAIWTNPDFVKTDAKGSAKNFLLHYLTYRVLDHFRVVESDPIQKDNNNLLQTSGDLSYSHVIEELNVKEIHLIIEDVLASLPKLSQQIFRLRWENNLTVQETAQQLSLSENTVRNRYNQALSALRSKLTPFILENGTTSVILSFLFFDK